MWTRNENLPRLIVVLYYCTDPELASRNKTKTFRTKSKQDVEIPEQEQTFKKHVLFMMTV